MIWAEIDDANIADGMVKKISELSRRAFLDKLIALVGRYNVPVTLLWPGGADVASEMHKTLARRNVYIHQGKLENVNEYHYDLLLNRVLCELWILKLLGCPDDKLDPVAWQHLDAIRVQMASQ